MRMVGLPVIVAVLMLFATPAEPAGRLVTGIGNGTQSCAKWAMVGTGPNMLVGFSWITGFWSGLNQLNSSNSHVGQNSNAVEIVAAGTRRCEAHKNENLMTAALAVYWQFASAGR